MPAALSLNGGLLFIVQFCINNIFVIFWKKSTKTENCIHVCIIKIQVPRAHKAKNQGKRTVNLNIILIEQ